MTVRINVYPTYILQPVDDGVILPVTTFIPIVFQNYSPSSVAVAVNVYGIKTDGTEELVDQWVLTLNPYETTHSVITVAKRADQWDYNRFRIEATRQDLGISSTAFLDVSYEPYWQIEPDKIKSIMSNAFQTLDNSGNQVGWVLKSGKNPYQYTEYAALDYDFSSVGGQIFYIKMPSTVFNDWYSWLQNQGYQANADNVYTELYWIAELPDTATNNATIAIYAEVYKATKIPRLSIYVTGVTISPGQAAVFSSGSLIVSHDKLTPSSGNALVDQPIDYKLKVAVQSNNQPLQLGIIRFRTTQYFKDYLSSKGWW